ncbi:sulfotransferase 1E1 [Parasteatoda tepidariorum]|uniref:sulfotransferase 1E1 n=1 Tax=Parasteatoda tepidariorum TaxID=114398 RepID=UPI00077FBF0D|nr:sulfotransferase 1E1-like [Parasteatoda tepidariorum]
MSMKSLSQIVDGFQIPGKYNPGTFRAALKYKPRDDDLFLVTYPKCGTTWTGQILLLLFQKGEPLSSFLDLFLKFPFLDLSEPIFMEMMPRPGPIKTHLPYHMVPWSKNSKYIYLTRNPKDCCVSYYYHMKNLPWHAYTGTFDDFFEDFLAGKTDYGDYFDHLLSWYSHRNDPNVLFLTYEELKQDIDSAILKMASFIDDEKFAELIRTNPDILSNIKKHSSMEEMREFMTKSMGGMATMKPEELMSINVPDVIKNLFAEQMCQMKSSDVAEKFGQDMGQFFRKGVTGDWRNHFSEDQSRRLDEKFAERTKNTDIPSLWKNFM